MAFKNLTFQGKVEGKALFSFGANEGAFKVLQNAAAGEVYEIEVVKNTQGYNDWVSATKSNGAAAPASSASAPGRSANTPSTGGYTATKSTYETPEERAKKQIYIVRQSSIGAAIESLVVGAKTPPKTDEIISRAKEFEAFVFGDSADEDVSGTDGFKDLDEMDDIPL